MQAPQRDRSRFFPLFPPFFFFKYCRSHNESSPNPLPPIWKFFRLSAMCELLRWPLRPLFFISLFLVTSARSFGGNSKKKKKNRPLELSSEVRSEPNMIVHANNNIVSKRGLPLVCFKCGSASPLPVAEEVSSKFQSAHPVCQECFAKGVCVRTRGQKQMRTWLPHWVTDLAWTLRCVWSQLKKNRSLYFCVPVTRCCVRVLGFFFWGGGGGGIIFFSFRSVAFLRKMWRETEIKINTKNYWK